MGQQLNYISKLNLKKKGVAKASFKRTTKVIIIRLETEWSNHEQTENFVKEMGGLNPRM